MITVVGNKPVMRRGDNEIGVVGTHNTKTLEFSIDRIQGAIDLNDYSAWALIERSAPNGGASYSTMVTKATVGDKITISLPITANETKDYGYIHASIRFATANAISAFANYGGTVAGTVKATSASHGLESGVTTGVVISGTTNYNGTYDVTKVDANNFYFTDTWVSDQTGWWGVSPIWQTERVLLKVAKGINGETEAEALEQNIFDAQVVAFEEAIAAIDGIENLEWDAITGLNKPVINSNSLGDNYTTAGILTGKLAVSEYNLATLGAMGIHSAKIGLSDVSSGAYSFAQGTGSTSSGNSSMANGYNVTSSGSYSHSEGYDTTSSGEESHAEGYDTSSVGAYSHSEGRATLSNAIGSHAEGYMSVARGLYSHAEGNGTLASGTHSHSEGSVSLASGGYSHSEGSNSTSSGTYSHSEGIGSTASATSSHAEGYQSTASGNYGHSEGYQSLAIGIKSHAEGELTRAEGAGTHTSGLNTKAITANSYGSICGQYGDTTETTLFAVANGTSLLAKSLALNIKPDEAIFSIPVLGVTATALDSSTKLATTAFVQGEIAKKKITVVSDTYDILSTDHIIICDKSTAFTVTLPQATAGMVGKEYIVKNIGDGTVTLSAYSGDIVDGETSGELTKFNRGIAICYDIGKWTAI